MKKWTSAAIKDYLEAVSKPTPSPGGGSVAALIGALGAALLEMSLGKSDPTHSLRRRLRLLRKSLLRFVDEDAEAFRKVARYWKGNSGLLLQRALAQATEVPLGICQGCIEGIQISKRIRSTIKPSLQNDWWTAKDCFATAFRSAALNVRYNLGKLDSSKKAQDLKRRWDQLRAQFDAC